MAAISGAAAHFSPLNGWILPRRTGDICPHFGRFGERSSDIRGAEQPAKTVVGRPLLSPIEVFEERRRRSGRHGWKVLCKRRSENHSPKRPGNPVDPFSLCQDGGAAAEVDIGWGEIVDALVVTAAIVVVDEGGDLGFEIARQEVVFQQMLFLRVWCQRSILPWVIG